MSGIVVPLMSRAGANEGSSMGEDLRSRLALVAATAMRAVAAMAEIEKIRIQLYITVGRIPVALAHVKVCPPAKNRAAASSWLATQC